MMSDQGFSTVVDSDYQVTTLVAILCAKVACEAFIIERQAVVVGGENPALRV